MKRPRYWLRALFVLGLILIIGEYVTLTYVAPRYLVRAAQTFISHDVLIDKARLSALLTSTLSGLSLRTNTVESALSVQQVTVRPRAVSPSSKTLWIDALEIEQPLLRFTWTKAGTMQWPSLSSSVARPIPPSPTEPSQSTVFSQWQAHIDSVKVIDGVVEFIDEKLPQPFHAIIDHISFDLGPMTFPSGGAQISFAIRGRAVGFEGQSAPLYCSGWLDLTEKALEASCQLEPLALAAFQPYYQGPPEIRVYGTTVQSTSQWSARANNLTASVQLELGNLKEGDISIHGRSIVDVKKLTKGQEPRLRGEVKLTGPLDNPSQWRAEFIAGDESIQRLVGRLLEHGIRVVKLPLWGRKLGVSIGTIDANLMQRFDEVGKEISEALEILAMPSPEEVQAPTLTVEPAAPIEGSLSPLVSPVVERQPSPAVTLPATPAPVSPPAPVTPEPASPPQPVSAAGSSSTPADVAAPASAPAPVR